MTRWKGAFVACLAVLSGLLLAAAAGAQGTGDRLLKASEGPQMPGSEADSAWWFVSYLDEDELPSAERFSELAGCGYPEDGVSRQDFDATLDHLGDVRPWMDRGQKKSARRFARLQELFHRRYDELAVYRCETGAEVPIYFQGVNEDGLSGLLTVNIEA
jgi:nuclease A inhibitor-like protein